MEGNKASAGETKIYSLVKLTVLVTCYEVFINLQVELDKAVINMG